jgi:hypothetical protein
MLIELFAIWSGGKAGYLYNVTLDGELVLDRSRDPEHDLARILLARGISGEHDCSSHAADAFGLMAIAYRDPRELAAFNRKILNYPQMGIA